MTHKPAKLFRRFGAILYDLLLVLSLIFVLGLVFFWFFPASDTQTNPAFFFVITLPVSFGYFAFFWRKSGQTLGMLAWRIQLITHNAKKITLKHCLIRYILSILSWLAFGLGFFYQWFNGSKYCFHDQYSHTCIIQIA